MYSPMTNEPSLTCDDINPGDILHSKYGRTVRTVLAIDGNNVILKTPNGSAGTISIDSARRFWRKIGTESQ